MRRKAHLKSSSSLRVPRQRPPVPKARSRHPLPGSLRNVAPQGTSASLDPGINARPRGGMTYNRFIPPARPPGEVDRKILADLRSPTRRPSATWSGRPEPTPTADAASAAGLAERERRPARGAASISRPMSRSPASCSQGLWRRLSLVAARAAELGRFLAIDGQAWRRRAPRRHRADFLRTAVVSATRTAAGAVEAACRWPPSPRRCCHAGRTVTPHGLSPSAAVDVGWTGAWRRPPGRGLATSADPALAPSPLRDAFGRTPSGQPESGDLHNPKTCGQSTGRSFHLPVAGESSGRLVARARDLGMAVTVPTAGVRPRSRTWADGGCVFRDVGDGHEPGGLPAEHAALVYALVALRCTGGRSSTSHGCRVFL